MAEHRDALEAVVRAAAGELGVDAELAAQLRLTETDDPEHGDLALPCFPLAKALRTAPAQIALALKERLDTADTSGLPLQRVETAGPYLNLFLRADAMVGDAIQAVLSAGDAYGSSRQGAGKRALVEHTSINPNASPHLGRARNAWIGDTIVRLLRFEGYEVDAHFFVNDVGKQIAMLVAGIGEGTPTFRELLDIYIDVNRRFEADEGFRTSVERLLQRLEQDDGSTRAAFRRIVEISVGGMEAIFADAGVRYQHFDYESDYLTPQHYRELVDQFRAEGKLFEDDEGRLVLDLDGYDLPSRNPVLVVARSDKTSLYPLRDISYTLDKVRRAPDLNVIVLGEDQKLYHQQITAALDILGMTAPRAVHYSYVLLESGSMSSREGNVVLLEDFVAEAKEKARGELEARGQEPDETVASAVAYSALKYAFLRVANEKQVTFKWEAAMAFEGETGPYLLYSYARLSSILRKHASQDAHAADDSPLPEAAGAAYHRMDSAEEVALAKELARMPEVVARAALARSPHVVAGHAYAVAKSFSAFYHACPILQSEPELRDARLLLVAATRQVLANVLGILGITPLEAM